MEMLSFGKKNNNQTKQLEIMNKFILTIITILAVTLTAIVYTTSDSIEIKALITLMDLPIIVLIALHLEEEN